MTCQNKTWVASGTCASALLCFFTGGTTCVAQNVIAPAPAISTTPSAVLEHENSNPMQVFAPGGAMPGPVQLLSWGPVTLRPHANYRFLYGNGIASSPGQQHNTIVQQLAPGMLVDIGTHWTLDYTPTLVFYSNRQFENELNHLINLGWGTAYNDWFFSASQSVTITSDPQVETGGQIDQQNYSTELHAKYQFNDKMSVDTSLNQDLNFLQTTGSSTNYVQNLANSQSWSTMNWLNYEFWPRLNAGLGIGLGYAQQQNSPDAISEQCRGRVNWRATDKISFRLNAGLFQQQYVSGGSGNLFSPVFGGTVQYQPFEHTRFSIEASRSVYAGYFQNQFTENTSITGDLRQRFLGWLFLDLVGSYEWAHYVSSTSGSSTSRDDDTTTFRARLSTAFAQHGSVAVFYQYSQNSSSQSGFVDPGSSFGYTSNQVGFEVGYSY